VADVVISYRNVNDRVLRQPLIVVEGFDPGHIVTPEKPEGFNTFRGFIVNIRNSESRALRNLVTENTGQYDIVYVNWRNGTDYLQRNALVLEEIIRWVNRNKQPLVGGGVQPNVVLGSSMGGVIARMALGRMDRAGGAGAHQTRLYVSMDAPHQGANVPLGYQAAARHAGRMYIGSGPIGGAVEVVKLVSNGASPLLTLLLADQPASRQMLTYRLNLFNQPANTAHEDFQQELRTTWAYPNPANVRSIAISNGSECGIDQEFAPGSSLLYHYRSIKTRFLSDLIGMAAGVGLGAIGFPLTTALAVPLVIPGSSKFELTLDIRTLANGGGNRVYYGNIRYTKKILWLVPATINIVNNSYTAPSGLLPLDTYPGSFFPPLDIKRQPGASSQDWAFTYNNSFYIQRRFGFIPTTSALDIGQGNTTLVAADYLARYVGGTPPAAPVNSPFANFTTAFNLGDQPAPFDNDNVRPLTNEPHEGFFLRNANWLAAELNGAPTQTNCAAACGNNNYSIVGNAIICTTSDYRINNLPAGTTVAWSIPASAQSALRLESNVPNPSELRITNQNAGTVTTTLTATISGAGCGRGDIVLTKTISNDNSTAFPYFQESCTFYNVSHPSQTGTTSGATFVHQGCMVYVNLGAVPRTVTLGSGGQPLTWGTSVNSRYPNTLYFQLPIGSGGVPFTFNLAGGGDCGNQSIVFFSYSNNGRYAYEAAPNPVGNEVTVVAKKNDDVLEQSKSKGVEKPLDYTVEVYEVSTGTRIMSQKNSSGSLQNRLNTSNFRPGLYLLHINDGEASYSIKISKE